MAKRRRDKDVAADKPGRKHEHDRDEWDEDGARPGQADEGDDAAGEAADTPPRRRRTLAEAAAESAAPGGVRCPRCHCGHSEVIKTWDVSGGRRRRRVCRHCGTEFPTTER